MLYTHSLSRMPIVGLTAYELIVERNRAYTAGAACEAYAIILFDEAGVPIPDVAQVLHIPSEGRLLLVWRGTSLRLDGNSVEAAVEAWVAGQREHELGHE